MDIRGWMERPSDAGTPNEIATTIVDAALKIHVALGPGLLESAHEPAPIPHPLRRSPASPHRLPDHAQHPCPFPSFLRSQRNRPRPRNLLEDGLRLAPSVVRLLEDGLRLAPSVVRLLEDAARALPSTARLRTRRLHCLVGRHSHVGLQHIPCRGGPPAQACGYAPPPGRARASARGSRPSRQPSSVSAPADPCPSAPPRLGPAGRTRSREGRTRSAPSFTSTRSSVLGASPVLSGRVHRARRVAGFTRSSSIALNGARPQRGRPASA